MEQFFTWLVEAIMAHWAMLALGTGVTVGLGVLKLYWPSVTDVLLYAIVGGVVTCICMLLLNQTRWQTEIWEKFANERPTRSYFTQVKAEIQNVSQSILILTVSVQNNDVPAKDVVSQILVIEESLDPTGEPLLKRRLEEANPVGPRGVFSHYWPVKVGRNARPAFVMFQIRYTDALSDKTYSQDLFLKFLGASQDGTFIQQLFNANSDEKTRMERYVRERGIPTL